MAVTVDATLTVNVGEVPDTMYVPAVTPAPDSCMPITGTVPLLYVRVVPEIVPLNADALTAVMVVPPVTPAPVTVYPVRSVNPADGTTFRLITVPAIQPNVPDIWVDVTPFT